MQTSPSVEKLWSAYLETLGETPETTGRTYAAWHFCDNPHDADELVALVKSGKKQATAGALWSYEADGDPIPEIGDHSVITDFFGEAQCIIRTSSVAVVPFNQVTAEFAACEGEGDGSLAYWRDAHWRFFSRELHAMGRQPEETMLVVCEQFEVVYQ